MERHTHGARPVPGSVQTQPRELSGSSHFTYRGMARPSYSEQQSQGLVEKAFQPTRSHLELCSSQDLRKGTLGDSPEVQRAKSPPDATNVADEIEQKLRYIPPVPKPRSRRSQNSCNSLPSGRLRLLTLAEHPLPPPRVYLGVLDGCPARTQHQLLRALCRSSLRKLATRRCRLGPRQCPHKDLASRSQSCQSSQCQCDVQFPAEAGGCPS